MIPNLQQNQNVVVQLPELMPFLSVVLIRHESPLSLEQQNSEPHLWLNDELGWFEPDHGRQILSNLAQVYQLRNQACNYRVIHYSERKKVTWSMQEDIVDFINHILVIASWGTYSAIHFSDNNLKENFISFLVSQQNQNLWPRPIEKDRLTTIFIDGPARTLWLAGIHKKKSFRADAKVLMGSRIQDTLNPLEDQSFYFTSARCFLRDWQRTTGVSPSKSQIWLRKSQSWDDFREMLEQVFIRLSENYDREPQIPFPILATPVTNFELINAAFDMNFLNPEVSIEDARQQDQEDVELLNDLSYHSQFDITGIANSPNTEGQLFYDNRPIGSVRVDFQNSIENRQNWNFEFNPLLEAEEILGIPPLDGIRRIFRKGKYLQIRYESGHTFSGGEFYSMRFRDLPFNGWYFRSFDGYNVQKEKPVCFKDIGRDHSLFCWVWNELAGNSWLYCDDSSGEVADFVRYEIEPNKIPKISLIHVKAAENGNNRRFSVSAYEVVTSQAIKNLRHFELTNLLDQIEHLDDEHFLYRIKFNNTIPADVFEARRFKEEFIRLLRENQTNIYREVIILQPHNKRSQIFRGDGNNNPRCQLHTLLLAIESACRSLGASFSVITDET